MRNIDVKAPLDDRAALLTRLRDLGARHQATWRMRDTFFEVPRGWLKLREQDGLATELIAYSRSTAESGPRPSDYEILAVPDAAAARRVLGAALPVWQVVDKERSLWLLDHTRIHLDRVDGLGEHLELETVIDGITEREARAESERLALALGLDPARFHAWPYAELLSRQGSRTPDSSATRSASS